jgi:hypothetical protein
MRKTASLLAFVIFSILNGIAQTNPYDLVGDTILFYNQATSLLDNRKKQESEVNSFNQLLSKYDVSLIDSARMALSKKKGIVKRIGGDKGGHWEVIDK